ncbi:MAG: flagellar hook basal-body protein [Candidatus Competibacteraceae bacterium]|nr:flagellar hook basal-body protein [Candidatus Competibacteraceae bacterium]
MSSMYTALSGINAASVNLDTTAHNIANSSTIGFKNSRAEFGDIMAGKNGIGVQTEAINQLFQQGGVISTGNNGSNGKLDLAISGNGFFQVANVAAGTSVTPPLYTRAGSFHVDAGGLVVNNLGQRLQGSGTPPALGGDITAPASATAGLFAGIASIDPDGTITFDDAAATTVKVGVYDFPNVQGLKAVGDTNWIQTAASGAGVALTTPHVMGGFLEASNADLTDQLVNMIVAQRNFQANAKTITTENTLSETIINIR